MKISPSQVKKAIVEQALIIKKKQDLYERAKQLNEEAKQVLNEMHAFEAGLGPGFVNSGSKATIGANGMPAQALGLIGSPLTSQPGDSADLNVVGSFKDLYNLDKDMKSCEQESEETPSSPEEKFAELQKKMAEISEELAKLQMSTSGLNEAKK